MTWFEENLGLYEWLELGRGQLSSGVVRPQRSPTALGYGQTPTPTPKENVGVTIYTYPSKNVLFMLIIRYFCKEDQVERAYLC